MKEQAKHNEDFKQLINGLLDGQLTPEQVARLERYIQTRPEAMKIYVDAVTLTVGLRKYSQTQRGAMKEVIERQTPDESALWQTLANDEKLAPAIKIKKKKKWLRWKPKTVQVRPKELNIERVRRNVSRLPVMTLVIASAALVLLLLYIRLTPYMHMAKLNDSVHAVWENHSNRFREGIGLNPVSQQQALKEGFAQVQFASGAQVLFEAPCQFVLENKDQLFLKQGKVFVKVPKEAIGFTVRTPASRIIDLGTEFGVMVDPDGVCRFQMFSGKASVIAGLEGAEKFSELLMAGQTCSVEPTSGKIMPASFLKERFVQRIDSNTNIIWRGEKTLSLADIVVGGNGLGTEPDGFLHPGTGEIKMQTPALTEEEKNNPPRTYISVSESSFVDGVFIPDGGKGSEKVTSAGHCFAFPKTSGTMHSHIDALTYYVTDENLGSQSYSPQAAAFPSFYLHANNGVTFNLEAIRQAYPDMKIAGFRTQYGIRWTGRQHSNKVDFWMLVDGQSRHEPHEKTDQRNLENAYIPLSDSDRFLTLATTESNDGKSEDWGVFVNPVLELVSR